MPGIQTILHPTDFSENSGYAFEAACALARDSHATLLVLHVMLPSVSPLQHAPPPDPRRALEAQESQVRLPWPAPSDPQIHVEHRLAEGDAAEEILRLAATARCDLIVLGTHGRTGLSRLLTGSVAEAVLRRAACPVMVVKAPILASAHAAPEAAAGAGTPVSGRPLGPALSAAQTCNLLHTTAVEVVRLIVRAGEQTAEQRTRGETVVQCVEGRVVLNALGKPQTLEPGTLLLLPAGEPHTFEGIEDASVLLTIVNPQP